VSLSRPLLFAAVLTFCAHAAVAQEAQVLNGIAAVVNDDVITFSQVRELTGSLEASLRANYSGNALTEHIKEVRLHALNDLIDRQLILQEFKKMKGQIPAPSLDRGTAPGTTGHPSRPSNGEEGPRRRAFSTSNPAYRVSCCRSSTHRDCPLGIFSVSVRNQLGYIRNMKPSYS